MAEQSKTAPEGARQNPSQPGVKAPENKPGQQAQGDQSKPAPGQQK